jgi:hypothetical protein
MRLQGNGGQGPLTTSVQWMWMQTIWPHLTQRLRGR